MKERFKNSTKMKRNNIYSEGRKERINEKKIIGDINSELNKQKKMLEELRSISQRKSLNSNNNNLPYQTNLDLKFNEMITQNKISDQNFMNQYLHSLQHLENFQNLHEYEDSKKIEAKNINEFSNLSNNLPEASNYRYSHFNSSKERPLFINTFIPTTELNLKLAYQDKDHNAFSSDMNQSRFLNRREMRKNDRDSRDSTFSRDVTKLGREISFQNEQNKYLSAKKNRSENFTVREGKIVEKNENKEIIFYQDIIDSQKKIISSIQENINQIALQKKSRKTNRKGNPSLNSNIESNLINISPKEMESKFIHRKPGFPSIPINQGLSNHKALRNNCIISDMKDHLSIHNKNILKEGGRDFLVKSDKFVQSESEYNSNSETKNNFDSNQVKKADKLLQIEFFRFQSAVSPKKQFSHHQVHQIDIENKSCILNKTKTLQEVKALRSPNLIMNKFKNITILPKIQKAKRRQLTIQKINNIKDVTDIISSKNKEKISPTSDENFQANIEISDKDQRSKSNSKFLLNQKNLKEYNVNIEFRRSRHAYNVKQQSNLSNIDLKIFRNMQDIKNIESLEKANINNSIKNALEKVISEEYGIQVEPLKEEDKKWITSNMSFVKESPVEKINKEMKEDKLIVKNDKIKLNLAENCERLNNHKDHNKEIISKLYENNENNVVSITKIKEDVNKLIKLEIPKKSNEIINEKKINNSFTINNCDSKENVMKEIGKYETKDDAATNADLKFQVYNKSGEEYFPKTINEDTANVNKVSEHSKKSSTNEINKSIEAISELKENGKKEAKDECYSIMNINKQEYEESQVSTDFNKLHAKIHMVASTLPQDNNNNGNTKVDFDNLPNRKCEEILDKKEKVNLTNKNIDAKEKNEIAISKESNHGLNAKCFFIEETQKGDIEELLKCGNDQIPINKNIFEEFKNEIKEKNGHFNSNSNSIESSSQIKHIKIKESKNEPDGNYGQIIKKTNLPILLSANEKLIKNHDDLKIDHCSKSQECIEEKASNNLSELELNLNLNNLGKEVKEHFNNQNIDTMNELDASVTEKVIDSAGKEIKNSGLLIKTTKEINSFSTPIKSTYAKIYRNPSNICPTLRNHYIPIPSRKGNIDKNYYLDEIPGFLI